MAEEDQLRAFVAQIGAGQLVATGFDVHGPQPAEVSHSAACRRAGYRICRVSDALQHLHAGG